MPTCLRAYLALSVPPPQRKPNPAGHWWQVADMSTEYISVKLQVLWRLIIQGNLQVTVLKGEHKTSILIGGDLEGKASVSAEITMYDEYKQKQPPTPLLYLI